MAGSVPGTVNVMASLDVFSITNSTQMGWFMGTNRETGITRAVNPEFADGDSAATMPANPANERTNAKDFFNMNRP